MKSVKNITCPLKEVTANAVKLLIEAASPTQAVITSVISKMDIPILEKERVYN